MPDHRTCFVDLEFEPFTLEGGLVEFSPEFGRIIQPEGMHTVWDALQMSAALRPGYNCLGFRPRSPDGDLSDHFAYFSYAQTIRAAIAFGEGLRRLEPSLEAGDRLNIFSVNCPQWTISQYASMYAGFVVVPLYETLSAEHLLHVTNDSGSKLVIVQYELLDRLRPLLDQTAIETIIVMDNLDSTKQKILETAPEDRIWSYTFSEVCRLGLETVSSETETVFEPDCPIWGHEQWDYCNAVKADPSDVAVIIYTSGSSGLPKGVCLTQFNLVAGACGLTSVIPPPLGLPSTFQEVLISFMPLSHVFAYVLEITMVIMGAAIAYFSGDTKKLIDDIRIAQPTMLCGVPRLFSKIYDKVMSGLREKGAISRFLVNYALNRKKRAMERGTTTPFWDERIFKPKIAGVLGGQLRVIFSGSAALPGHIAEFLRAAFCTVLAEGYGLTETSSGVTVSHWNSPTYGHVGKGICGASFKLIDRPDLGYLSTDQPFPRGEICLSGPQIFVGYWNLPDKTAEVLQDGWFMTGDIGTVDEYGNLRIIDRVGNVFKTPHGEFVEPDALTNVYKSSEYLGDIAVFGGAVQLVAVAYLDPVFEGTDDDLTMDILGDLKRIADDRGLRGFERIGAIYISEEWTVDSGLLTPSSKQRRKSIQTHFASEIQHMVDDINALFGAQQRSLADDCCTPAQ